MRPTRIARFRSTCIGFACALTCALAGGLTCGLPAFAADPAPKSVPQGPYDDGMPRHLQELFDPNAQVDRIVEHRSQQLSLKAERTRIDMKGPLPARSATGASSGRVAAPARPTGSRPQPMRSAVVKPAAPKPVPPRPRPAPPKPVPATTGPTGPTGAAGPSPCCTR